MPGFSHLLCAGAVLGAGLGEAVKATEPFLTPRGSPQFSVPVCAHPAGSRGSWRGGGAFLKEVMGMGDSGEAGTASDQRLGS